MLNIKKKKDIRYLYLVPVEEDLANWEILSHEELEERVANNELEEDGRLFKVEKEVAIRFEKRTFLD